ncbi:MULTISPECIES: cytochrome c-type biogenesis protein [Alteromonas]|uniref:Cytochrome c-type biogenesis protein n=1 Tax=Alteromonas macleodii TaxID=28108 RepID=A0A1E7DJE0_ALTMA|nr:MULTISPECIES: cytochrome c-type biogenesis protein [Alteromonas]MEC8489593.1 cytochrome c-type biogenesis protein [Pseudomonadota bacterium]MCG7647864.1 cytochrome c-type biogenesis protein CcmH [Alteromonas sp. MmMcT2-5]MCS5577911.1 cytochrome c-type biogenesis protein CcmH [Alteromonas macleodii]OES34095.1 cytochrome C biogenesis family protein [Alteromonas macleodii]OES35802.1 cytochrome C biogenesis family protein [Alteromonas macleodii]|tara:strand:+ start:230 stop:721 length:492 start_codon:yes stop_codon:yes gene_type:complete
MLSDTSSHSLASFKAIALNVLALLFVLSAYSVIAAEDKFSFDTPAQRESFLKLTAELRCPMCQNQNIADSDAMIAHDMRRKVYALLKQGKTEQEVIDFMKSRYGDFVHYQPPVTAATLWLWAGPVLFIFIALIVVVRRKSVTPPEDMAAKLAKADEMLEREKE